MTGRMLGVTKDGEVTTEQQYMLFCITLRKRFNVGQVIYNKIDSIKKLLISDKFGKISLAFPSLITRLCQHVPMQDNFYTMENLAPLDRDTVSGNVGRISSIMDFHLDKWGGKGTEDWVRPIYDQHQALPAPPAGSEIPEEGEELEDDIPPPDQPPPQQDVDFSISQEMWTNMQSRLDGYDTRLGNI